MWTGDLPPLSSVILIVIFKTMYISTVIFKTMYFIKIFYMLVNANAKVHGLLMSTNTLNNDS